jgi:hypothetical protein
MNKQYVSIINKSNIKNQAIYLHCEANNVKGYSLLTVLNLGKNYQFNPYLTTILFNETSLSSAIKNPIKH